MTTYFFKKLHENEIPTHFIKENMDEVSLEVKDAVMFGNGLEVICRYRAGGRFYRRYGAYCEEGQALDAFVEMTTKADERGDPLISQDAVVDTHLSNHEESVE